MSPFCMSLFSSFLIFKLVFFKPWTSSRCLSCRSNSLGNLIMWLWITKVLVHHRYIKLSWNVNSVGMFPAIMTYAGIKAQYVIVHFSWNIIWYFISRNFFASFFSDTLLIVREPSDLDKTVCIVLSVVRPRVDKNIFWSTVVSSPVSFFKWNSLVYLLYYHYYYYYY